MSKKEPKISSSRAHERADPAASVAATGGTPDSRYAIEAVRKVSGVSSLLEVIHQLTGMRFVVVARVTEGEWTACAVLDKMDFGLGVGGTLEVATTLCSEVRSTSEAIVIEHAAADKTYYNHPTPKKYGIESYIAVPIIRRSGEFFGTLCAIDPLPVKFGGQVLPTFQLFAELIATQMDSDESLASLRSSENRYRAFVENSSEGIWRFDLDAPIDTSLPVDRQVELAFERGFLAECNLVFARQYGFASTDEMIGTRLDQLMLRDDPKNTELLTAFIEGKYRLSDAESHEQDSLGSDRYFLNNFVGTLENGQLKCVWGTQRDVTQERDRERARAHLAAIIESSDDAIISKDLNGVITSWNSGAEAIFGYTAEEVVGQHISKLMPEERRVEAAEILGRIRRGERVEHFETQRLHKEGRLISISLTVSPIKGDDGNIIGASKIARDITQQRDAEAALDRYRLMSTQARDIILFLEPKTGRIAEANDAAVKMYGFSRDELLTKSIRDLRAPETLSALDEQYREAGRSGTQFETIHMRADGSRFPVEVSAAPAEIGRTRTIISIIRDISERRRSEEALLQNQVLLQLSMQASGLGTWERDLASDTVIWSAELEALFGLSEGEFRSTEEHFYQLIHEDDRERVWSEVEAAIIEKRPYATEFRFYHADGSVRWMEGRGEAVYSTDGTPIRLYGTGADITGRKENEARLRLSEARAQSAIEVARLGTWALDLESQTVDLDEQMSAIWGEPRGHFTIPITKIVERIHPDDRDRVTSTIEAALDPEQADSYDIEFRIIWPDGSVHWLLTNGRVGFEGVGGGRRAMSRVGETGTHIGGTALDITERKKLERSLADSEDRFRALMEQAPFSVQLFSPDGRTIRVNRAWEDLWGVTLDLIPDYNVLEDPQLETKGVAETLKRAFEGETVELPPILYDPNETLPDRSRHADPSRWVSAIAYPLKDTDGNIREIALVHQDITDRKVAEDRVAYQNTLLNALTETVLDGILIVSPEGRMIRYNQQFVDIWQFPEETLRAGLDGSALEWAARKTVDPEGFLAHVTDIYEQDDRSYREEVLFKDGRVYERFGAPIRNGDEKIGWVWTFRDITDRKQAEETLRRNHETFFNLVHNTPFGIYVVDADFRLIEVSAGSRKVFENVHPLIGRDFAEVLRIIWKEPFASEAIERFRHTLATGEVYRADDTTEKRGDIGETESYDWKIERITLPDGRYGVVCYFYDLTERKLWEDKLRESEERFSKAFNASPLALTISSLTDGRLVEVNDTFIEATGYSRAEAIGKTTVELGLWVSNDDREAELSTVRELGGLGQTEYRFRKRNGEEVVGLLAAEKIEIGGEPYALTVIQDITARKQAEDRIRENEATLRAYYNSSPMMMGIVELDDADNITHIYDNPATEKFFGHPEESTAGRTSEELGSEPFVRELWTLNYRRSFDTHQPIHFEYAQGTPSGSRWLSVTVSPIGVMPDGRTRFAYVAQDVTEEKEAQEALIRAERKAADEYHELLQRIVPLGETLGTAHELRTIYRALLDFVRDSVSCSAFFVSFYDSTTNLRTAAFAWGSQGEVDTSLLPPIVLTNDGGPNSQAVFQRRPAIVNHYMELMKTRPHVVLADDGHDPRSALAVPMIVGDLVIGTIEVQSYEDDAFRNEHVVALEMVANLAAVAIENVRLIQVEATARSQAETANRAKDEFLSVLSHELRTPLNAMLGWVRMLRSDVLDKESTAKALEVIERNTRLQSSLIEDLLDVSRIISGKMRIETETVDLVSVINTVSEGVRPLANAKNITYRFDSKPTSLFLDADPVRLQQVATNLLQNAIKFTPAGGKVDVSIERIDQDAVLRVTDSGVGIDPEFLPHIFDRFRQADASTKRHFAGLGLGLTIVRTIVALHGGEISADSDGPGKGSTFTVTIPLSREFYSRSSNGDAPTPAKLGAGLDGISVLIVDDDEDGVTPMKLFLETEKALVDVASSAAGALSRLRSGNFDVMISDIGMPGMDGYELIREVRRQPRAGRPMPAIALTAYASEDDRRNVLQSGFDAHLAKPVDFNELLDILTDLTHRS